MLIPLFVLTFPWWVPYLQLNSYANKSNIYHSQINGVIDETGITINGKDAKSSFLWSAFTHYNKTNDLMLVYQSKNCFNIFTRSLFSTKEDWDKFEDLVKQRISLPHN
jgi:hypothetical protein